jgi:hypothetical protein
MLPRCKLLDHSSCYCLRLGAAASGRKKKVTVSLPIQNWHLALVYSGMSRDSRFRRASGRHAALTLGSHAQSGGRRYWRRQVERLLASKFQRVELPTIKRPTSSPPNRVPRLDSQLRTTIRACVPSPNQRARWRNKLGRAIPPPRG